MDNGASTRPDSSASGDLRKPVERLADTAISTARDLQQTATDIASSSADAIKSQASDFVDAAKDVASQAGERIQQQVSAQKGVGADYVEGFANSMRRAADQLDGDVPYAADYIRKAAEQVDDAADAVRQGDFKDLLRGAQTFARDQPTAFLALSVLAGFGVARFLKSSAAAASRDDEAFEATSSTTKRRKAKAAEASDHA